MSKLGIGFAILALSTSTIVRAQEPRMTVQNSGQINGALLLRHCQRAQMAVVSGDPAEEGAFRMRVKFPVSYKIPPHSHPNDEVVTVISGDFHVGIGRHSMKASETA